MQNPGPFQLTMGGVGAFSVVAAGTYLGDWVAGFAGILAASFQAQFLFGSGSGAATLYIQTSVDQGQTPIDVAAIQFSNASETAFVNLSGLTPRAVFDIPTQQSLAAGAVNDGVLGDRFRAVLLVTGAYNNGTLLNVTGCAR
jgi:hypothetical protein